MKRTIKQLLLLLAVFFFLAASAHYPQLATVEILNDDCQLVDEIRVHEDDLHTLSRNLRTDRFMMLKATAAPNQYRPTQPTYFTKNKN